MAADENAIAPIYCLCVKKLNENAATRSHEQLDGYEKKFCICCCRFFSCSCVSPSVDCVISRCVAIRLQESEDREAAAIIIIMKLTTRMVAVVCCC